MAFVNSGVKGLHSLQGDTPTSPEVQYKKTVFIKFYNVHLHVHDLPYRLESGVNFI